MQIISQPKCLVRYRTHAGKVVINKSELIGLGVHEKLKSEFSFSDCEIPKEIDHEELIFRNGRKEFEGKTYSIENLSIGNVGLSCWAWSGSDIVARILDRVVEIIDNTQQGERLSELRKMVFQTCQFKAKLDIDPDSLVNKVIVEKMREIAPKLKDSEFSKVETHFPALAFAFVLKPDTERILANVDPSKVEEEIKYASKRKVFYMACATPKDYEERMFTIESDTTFAMAEAILQQIEMML